MPMRRLSRLVATIPAWCAGAALLTLAPPGLVRAQNERPSVGAVRVTSRIELDGRLDETAWAEAPAATGFRQREPDEGAPATQRTETTLAANQIAAARFRALADAGINYAVMNLLAQPLVAQGELRQFPG